MLTAAEILTTDEDRDIRLAMARRHNGDLSLAYVSLTTDTCDFAMTRYAMGLAHYSVAMDARQRVYRSELDAEFALSPLSVY